MWCLPPAGAGLVPAPSINPPLLPNPAVAAHPGAGPCGLQHTPPGVHGACRHTPGLQVGGQGTRSDAPPPTPTPHPPTHPHPPLCLQGHALLSHSKQGYGIQPRSQCSYVLVSVMPLTLPLDPLRAGATCSGTAPPATLSGWETAPAAAAVTRPAARLSSSLRTMSTRCGPC